MISRTATVTIICKLLFVGMGALADAPSEPSAFDKALSERAELFTNESYVEIGGRKFRKIVYRDSTYYLQLLNEASSTSDLVVLCGDQGAQKFNSDAPPLVTGAVRVTKRTRLFIEGIKSLCSGTSNQPQVNVSSAVLIGFMIDDSADPKAVFKNKRVFVNPFKPGLGFRADF